MLGNLKGGDKVKAYVVTCDVDESLVLVEAKDGHEAVNIVADKTIDLFGIPSWMVKPMQDLVFHVREATEAEASEYLPINDAQSDEEYLSREIRNGALSKVGLDDVVGVTRSAVLEA